MRDILRRFLHDRTFAAVAIVTLGLGIGANTAIFSLVKAVMLRPLPYAEPANIVLVWNTAAMGDTTWLSANEILSYREGAPALDLAAHYTTDGNFTGGQEPERVRVALVTPNMMDVLGVQPALGRAFTPADGVAGSDDGIVLGHGLWQRRYGGDAGIVGRRIDVNGRQRTIVGVMPEGFKLPLDYRTDRPTEAWTPLVLGTVQPNQWGNRQYIAVGRVRDGVEPKTATAQLHAASAGWIAAGSVRDRGDGMFTNREAIPAQVFLTGTARTPLYMLLGTVAFVLLIAIANVVNLLMARADARRQEMAIRAALGAGRARLVRQMLTESVALATAGAAFGLALAWSGLRILSALRPASLPRAGEASIDAGVLAFTAVIALASGVLFGIAPAVRFSGGGLISALRDETRGGTASRSRRMMRRALVASQVAMSVVLVLGAGLLGRSLIALTRIDPGFETANVLTAQLQLPQATYTTPEQMVAFYRDLTSRLAALPGVEGAGAVRIIPLTRIIGDWSITIEGQPFDPIANPNGDWQIATPGYFEVLGLKMAEGRPIAESDREDAQPVVVINETMAARYWAGGSALGKRFHLGTSDRPWMTIVGVVRDVRHNAIVEEPRAEMYVPHAQWAAQAGGGARGMAVVMKTAGDPMTLAAPLRSTVRAIDPNLPVADVETMDAVMARALAEPRFTAGLLVAFAALALTLAAVGIYGMVSLVVTEQSREIGIRMALGAGRRSVLTMVLRQGAIMAGAGVAAGLGAAFLLLPLIESLLYGVEPLDAGTFTSVAALLLAVALAGSLAPARRASRVDPAGLLRK